MPKPTLQELLKSTQAESAAAQPPFAKSATGGEARPPSAKATKPAPKRIVHKPGEVNISAYFPPEVKSALRLVQAKTGNNVKQCLAEALADYFRKHNVPVTVPLA
jgi:Antitoxin-like ribbon-helix-helix